MADQPGHSENTLPLESKEVVRLMVPLMIFQMESRDQKKITKLYEQVKIIKIKSRFYLPRSNYFKDYYNDNDD